MANILFLPILLYNKFKINKSINIFKELIQCLNIYNFTFKKKIAIVKKNRLII